MKNALLLLSLVALSAVTSPVTGFAAETPPVSETTSATVRLEDELLTVPAERLAAQARRHGSATRGAILFHQPVLGCSKCHSVGGEHSSLGPDLAVWEEPPDGSHIVESILRPSKELRKGFEAVSVLTDEGRLLTGLIESDGEAELVLKDPSREGQRIRISKASIDLRQPAGSIMPTGLANQLASRQQFLDLAKYLIEVARQGPARAEELRPPEALFALPPLPEYEKQVDHAGLIESWDDESFERGRAIYNVLCINCHGTKDRPGSLPTSLRFAEDRFKNGSDPYSMYLTLTHGFGMMIPQRWMVPQQKYDVIHYIREHYIRPDNSSEYVPVTAEYLRRLPEGNTRGPEPQPYEPWANMNYGPTLTHTYEAGRDGSNIAYKGIAVRLDSGPGGVTRGRNWMIFDHDTLRVSAAWSGAEFIDYNGIMFNGRHNIHPRIAADIHLTNPTGPGWANPATGSFDDPRLRGRDGKPYGPLPRNWAHYNGMYHFGNRAIFSYTVGNTQVLEMPGVKRSEHTPLFTRAFNIGPRPEPMLLQVGRHRAAGASELTVMESADGAPAAVLGKPHRDRSAKGHPPAGQELTFDGKTYLSIERSEDFDLTSRDFTITARIRTDRGGTIFAKTAAGDEWVPDGKALFVRHGRLVYDIGWVGDVVSRRRVNDGHWHDLALTWDKETARVALFIDGKPDHTGQMRPKEPVHRHRVRIGFAAPDFPRPRSFFDGDIASVRFYSRKLSSRELSRLDSQKKAPRRQLLAGWLLNEVSGERVTDRVSGEHSGAVRRGTDRPAEDGFLVAGITGHSPHFDENSESTGESSWKWKTTDKGDLRLRIPAGDEPLRFTLAVALAESRESSKTLASAVQNGQNTIDLSELIEGGPPRWKQKLRMKTTVKKDGGPFEVDVLTRPAANPWNCRVRFTGLDFLPDGSRLAVCTWDGDVWMVSGLDDLSSGLTWQRIASGLFQPLGLKYVDGKIHLTCRDQLCILHDLNGDGETDFYENFNNDHQVTEHFHEFAMGLQTDEQGNFYYAKSARHALPAIVPHHGTLLKVDSDGSKTEILATGFRAANGVCLNPDGTFYVTDQEGHWTPKNRINRVKTGGFYGNMLGYHDVESSSDDAMQQPLCWITNSFDRSPSELLWVDRKAEWGPLNGSLLSLSYGYGKVFIVLRQEIDGQMQGGLCELPLPSLPTGLTRGRFHPKDGQLYVCGMFAWGSSRQQPGGLYRIRYTGEPLHAPIDMTAVQGGVRLRFPAPLDATSASRPENYTVKVWSLKRTKNYGSKHHNEHLLPVSAARLQNGGRIIHLAVPDLEPTQCIAIHYKVHGDDNEPLDGVIHGTIHELPNAPENSTPESQNDQS